MNSSDKGGQYSSFDHPLSILGLPSSLDVSPERTRNNEAFTDAEALKRKTVILPNARRYLAMLRAMVKDAERLVADNETLLTPIRRLPNEVLLSIFSLCCEPEELSGFEWPVVPGSSICDAMALDALSLSHVCFYWRQIVLSIPRLWTDISVCLDNVVYSEKELVRCHNIIRLYLQRSEDRLLSIRFRFPTKRSRLSSKNGVSRWHRAVLITLLKHSNRWHQAHLGMFRCDINDLAWDARGLEFSKLGILTVDCLRDDGDPILGNQQWDIDWEGGDSVILQFPTQIAPKLNTVFLKDTPFEYEMTNAPRLPLLSRLEVKSIYYTPLAALEWAPQDCSVIIRDDPYHGKIYNMENEMSDTVSCCAHSIAIEISRDQIVDTTFLTWLYFSEIKKLRLAASNDSDKPTAFEVELLESSFADTIETLALVHVTFDPLDFISVLESKPKITTLSVHECCQRGAASHANYSSPRSFLND